MSGPDVVIVGAGPAGSIAALVLARAGARVLVLDRERFPREKLCGDTLNPGALSMLDRLDVPAQTAVTARTSLRPGIASRVRDRALRISGMTITGSAAVSVTADYPEGLYGAAICRRDLDAVLLEAAVAAGAEFEPGRPVTGVEISEGRVTGVRAGTGTRRAVVPGRVTIAADGRASSIAFGLGLARFVRRPRRWAYGAYYSDVEGQTSHGEMHVRRDGYIGVAPVPGGATNVCVVRDLHQLRGSSGRQGAVHPEQVLTDALASEPLLANRFSRAKRVSPVTCLGPLGVQATAAGLPGLLTAGDASGFVDPMTGDGLRFAIRGGELAAIAALRELATGAPSFDALAAQRQREFSGKWRLNRTLRWLVGVPYGVSAGSAIAAWWPSPVRQLVNLAGDVALARPARIATADSH